MVSDKKAARTMLMMFTTGAASLVLVANNEDSIQHLIQLIQNRDFFTDFKYLNFSNCRSNLSSHLKNHFFNKNNSLR